MDDMKIAKRLIAVHKSAASRGIHFNLSFSAMKKLMKRKTCYYTGMVMTHADTKGDAALNASVDRIDSSGGYTDDNVVMCTAGFNSMKSNLDNKQLEKILLAVQKLNRRNIN